MMNLWDLSNKSFCGEAVFHIHSSLTDGNNTVGEYCEFFKKTGEILVFVEHIRKRPSYDFSEFIETVHREGHLAGFEAKLLPNGDLDLPEEALEKADLLAVAIHSLELSCLNNLINCLKNAFSVYSLRLPLVWVHPMSSKVESSLVTDKMLYLREVLDGFKSRIGVEHNLRHIPFQKSEIDLISQNNPVIKGYDAHSVRELLLLREIEKEKMFFENTAKQNK